MLTYSDEAHRSIFNKYKAIFEYFDAAFAAFGQFIAEERPNADQMSFLEKVVDYIVENGCIENVRDLMSAPFDRSVKFSILFTPMNRRNWLRSLIP